MFKRPTTLLKRILQLGELQLGILVERDVQEIEHRFENEGFSFLTIALPRLDSALLAGLSRGHINRYDFVGFKPHRRTGRLPALMQGFFMRVFDGDGRLLPEPCVESIRIIRQVSRLFKKVKMACSKTRIARAYERYVSNDQQISWNVDRCISDVSLLGRVASYLWSDLERLSGELYCFPGIFGSGATAEHKSFNERHNVRTWPKRSNASFPADYHATYQYELDSNFVFRDEGEEEPVRVVQVPKTLETPRTISVEPSYMMLMQQSVAKPLMEYLEINPLTRCIRFKDQSVNKELARVGSIDGSLSTIDLSDASDLVSNDLVRYIFRSCPTFLDLIQDCRTSRAKLPDGTILNLKKFASMGSALCFPIEAMVFATIAISAIVEKSGVRLSHKLLAEITACISVYGDDIIVPTEMSTSVMENLEAYGLKVNRSKSYNTGLFRESCGGDYFAGVCVTPVYCRMWDDTGSTRDAELITSLVSLSNQFYLKGYWHASQEIRSHLDRRNFKIPITVTEVGCLSFRSVFRTTDLFYDARLHKYRIKGLKLLSKSREDDAESENGRFILAFGSRHHHEALAYFRQTCRDYFRTRSHRICDRDGYSNDVNRKGCELYHDPSERRDWIYNGVPPQQYGGRSIGSDTRNANLPGPVSVSSYNRMYASTRPHALFLKRGWCPVEIPTGIRW